VKPVERKEDVARDDELGVCASALRAQCRERVIARHVRVHNLYSMSAHQARQLKRASNVERVAQPKPKDILFRQRREFSTERRARHERRIHFMAALSQRIR
jgi:hypothetical protein